MGSHRRDECGEQLGLIACEHPWGAKPSVSLPSLYQPCSGQFLLRRMSPKREVEEGKSRCKERNRRFGEERVPQQGKEVVFRGIALGRGTERKQFGKAGMYVVVYFRGREMPFLILDNLWRE